MTELFGGGLLEGGHVGAQGIHGAKHVAHGAVLAARVHGLEDDQQGVLGLRVHEVLQLAEPLEIFFGFGASVFLGEVFACVARDRFCRA